MTAGTLDPLEPLGRAVNANDTEAARRVLAAHPELKARLDEALPGAGFGATALLVAVSHRNRELIDLLLQTGADINVGSHWWAGSFGVLDSDSGLEDFLIGRGAMLTAHAAARLGRLDRLRELVADNPAVVHQRGGDGQTPLHFAASVEVASFLLEHGAEIDATDIDHESTPAQWMLENRHPVARYLVSRGCRTDLLMAAALGDLPLVQRHLEADPAIIRMSVSDEWFPRRNPKSGGTIYNWTLNGDKTAHFVARMFGHEEIYRFLMARSPEALQLTVACEVGDETLVRELRARRPDLVGALSDTELRKLPVAGKDSNVKAVRLMLAAGWPVNTRGQQHGETALHWAAFHGNPELVREILPYDPDLELRSLEYDGTALHWGIHGSRYGWHPERGDYATTVRLLLEAGAKAPPLSGGLQASKAVLDVLRRNG
jgi:ankyrin repeat protein